MISSFEELKIYNLAALTLGELICERDYNFLDDIVTNISVFLGENCFCYFIKIFERR